MIAIGLASACGSRSGLLAGGGGNGGSGAIAPQPDAAAGTGASSGSGGAGGSGAAGGSAGSGGSAGAPFICQALSAGAATEVLSFPDRHAVAPSAVLLDALSPPRVALQAFATGGNSLLHDDIRLARYVADDAAPAGISLELDPILAGIESHGWGNLALAPGGLRDVALAWHGDPGGFGRPMFRTIDFDTWSPGSTADLTQNGDGEAVLALAPGASTGAFGAGYAGNGYGVVWRDVLGPSNDSTRPVAAVLDAAGSVMIGPHEVSAASAYPGRSPSLVWSGTTYLLATAVENTSIVISRIRPASGDAVDDSGIESVAVLEVTPNWFAGRPALARDGDVVRIAWLERAPAGSDLARIVTATLATNGELVAMGPEPTAVAPESRVAVHARNGAMALAWVEVGDAALPDDTPGRSRIVVQFENPDGSSASAAIPSPLFHDYGAPNILGRGAPGTLLAVWGARSMKDGHDVTYAARLDCIELD